MAAPFGEKSCAQWKDLWMTRLLDPPSDEDLLLVCPFTREEQRVPWLNVASLNGVAMEKLREDVSKRRFRRQGENDFILVSET